MRTLTIGQVAAQTGTNAETLRFYEREGLIPPPARSDAGYRHYSDAVIQRVRFIQRAKEVGFSLREIGELLSLRADPHTSCAEVKARAQEKIASIEAKQRDLETMRAALAKLARQCRGRGPVSECPILDALNG